MRRIWGVGCLDSTSATTHRLYIMCVLHIDVRFRGVEVDNGGEKKVKKGEVRGKG